MAGDLVGAHDVERLARVRLLAGMDRAVRHDDRRQIVLEQRRQRADGRLVAGHDRDRAGQAGGAQMLAQRVLGHFAADQRIAHLARAVADAVRGGDRVLGLDQAHLELVRSRADAGLELGVDRLDLGQDAEIALAVALGADHADRRLVNEGLVGPKRAGDTDRLGRAARVPVNGHKLRLHHNHPIRLADIGPPAGERVIYHKLAGPFPRFLQSRDRPPAAPRNPGMTTLTRPSARPTLSPPKSPDARKCSASQ